MKRFPAPILLMVFLFPSLALGLELDDLVERNGLFYEKFTNVPFSGKMDEGLERGSFKDGKRDGPWVYYNEDGTVDEEVTYKNGRKVE